LGEGLFAPQPVTGTFQTDNLGVMNQPIDQGSGDDGVASEDLPPGAESPVGSGRLGRGDETQRPAPRLRAFW